MRRQRLKLPELIADVRSDVVPGHHVTLDLDVPVDLTTTGDPADLHRLFRNVIEKAVRYPHSHVTVTVTARVQRHGTQGNST